MTGEPTARPLYLELDHGPVFAFLHEAAHPAPGGVAVLICGPFAWDDVASYRSRRAWARHLAAAGHPTLRFDWPGTGDSGGSPRDGDLLGAWCEAAAGAAAWLRGRVGARRVVGLGIGLGGLVTWRAVAAAAAIDDLALWAVPSRGRRFVRELTAFGRLQQAGAAVAGEAEEDHGLVQAGGFLFTPETLGDVQALDVEKMPLTPAPGARALVLDRDGMAADTALADGLERAGFELTERPGPGFGAMTSGPQEARAPLEVFDRVTEWLAGASPDRGRPMAPGAAPAHREGADIDAGGVSVHESPFSIEQPFGRLFGVLSRPATGTGDVCAVLFNAGAMRRIGPNRMWVELARRWAARGVTTLRVDLEGIGDADGDGDRYARVAELYVPEFIDQAVATVEALAAAGLGRRFLAGGLCSGAYWAFHAAQRDERIRAVYLLNPQVLFWDPAVAVARDVRRVGEVLRASGWRRVLRGQIPLGRALAVVRSLLRSAVRAVFRFPRRLLVRGEAGPAQENRLDQALDDLERSGTHVVMLFGEQEPLRDEFEREGTLPHLSGRRNVSLELLACDAHTLGPIWAQRSVHGVLDRALERDLAPAQRSA